MSQEQNIRHARLIAMTSDLAAIPFASMGWNGWHRYVAADAIASWATLTDEQRAALIIAGERAYCAAPTVEPAGSLIAHVPPFIVEASEQADPRDLTPTADYWTEGDPAHARFRRGYRRAALGAVAESEDEHYRRGYALASRHYLVYARVGIVMAGMAIFDDSLAADLLAVMAGGRDDLHG